MSASSTVGLGGKGVGANDLYADSPERFVLSVPALFVAKGHPSFSEITLYIIPIPFHFVKKN
jgi:hypothetical protein